MNQQNYRSFSAEQQAKAPLYEALLEYRARKDASFHVPGHKDGVAARQCGGRHASAADHPLAGMMEIDVTEITGTDDLHHPEGAILEAQELASALFGAEETFFLVGGSTVGNLAMILSVCSAPGDVLLVQRNVHKSVIHGLMLAGARAVFLAPQLDPASGLATIPSAKTVREALDRYPGAKGLLVTHPNYYGMGTSLAPLAKLCAASGVPLLVDEAHGAHFGLHPALPASALAEGASAVVQSTHKMLGALTMGAMLHVQGGLLDRTLLRQRLAMVQSSSPSYPIMASLDLCRSQLAASGPAYFESALETADKLRRGIVQLPRFGQLHPIPGASGDAAAYATQDPFKVVIYDAARQWSGYQLQALLEAAGCVPEMSDERYVVLALGPGSRPQDADRLLQALREMSNDDVSTWNIANQAGVHRSKFEADKDTKPETELESVSSPVSFNLRPLSEGNMESVPLSCCAGRQAAEMVVPYPPGIPLLYPGEWISEQKVKQLEQLRQSQAKCQGVKDVTLTTIQVIKLIEEGREPLVER